MSAALRLTPFPSLHVQCQEGHASAPVFCNRDFQRHQVVLSWSLLLRGYVSEDPVVFAVDNEVLCVNFDINTVESCSKSPEHHQTSQGSAIYFEAAPPYQDLAPICVLVGHKPRAISVVASLSLLSEIQLKHLCSQLAHILGCTLEAPIDPDHILKISRFNVPLVQGLSIVNPNPQFLSGPRLLHHLLQQSPLVLGGLPSDTAIDFLLPDGITRRAISYGQLDIVSNRFAQKLLRILQTAERTKPIVVPVLVPQSAGLYVALLGILKAGAAFAPIHPDVPEERLKRMLSDVSAKVVVVHELLLHRLAWDRAYDVIAMSDEEIIDGASLGGYEIALPDCIDPHSAAYVMYTSGSTGTPKGVIISHLAATQTLLAHDKHVPFYRRFLQFASPTFDVFVFEVFFTFYRGVTLAGSDRPTLLNDTTKVINLLEVDAVELTPTVLGGLVVHKENIPNVTTVFTIGEMITRHIVEEFGGGLLHNLYGPTETTIHCTIASGVKKGSKVEDVGVPLDTVSAFIIHPTIQDGRVEVLPFGWVGELAIGGHQLADGYLNRPELTKEAFIDTVYGKLYRTGDRARIVPEGRIQCLGRLATGQIKLRGQRIELGEIEEALRKVPGARNAAVAVVESNLIGFVGGDSRVTSSSINAEMKKWLLGYMIPSQVYIYDDLPQLLNGKVDRSKLEAHARSKLYASGTMSDMTAVERRIMEALKELLNLEHVSKSESLIAQGLDSLRTIQLCSKLRGMGLAVQVTDVLRTDSIQKLALELKDSKSTRGSLAVDNTEFNEFYNIAKNVLEKGGFQAFDEIEAIIPCTHLQEAMLLETLKDSKAYTNWVLLDIPFYFTNESIEYAFNEVIKRNEILRTGFFVMEGSKGGPFAQVIWKSSQRIQFRISSTIRREFQFSIDAMLLPPLHIDLVRNEHKTYLSIYIHHALYDGWCWEHVLGDLESLLSGQDAVTLVPRIQFREVVKYTRAMQTMITCCRDFWKDFLNSAPSSFLPNFHGCSDVLPEVRKKSIRLRTSRRAIEACARSVGISPQVIVQTAWACLLSCYLNSLDIVFGIVGSGRTIPIAGIEGVIGPCIVTLPLRVTFTSRHAKCITVMRKIQALNREFVQHGDISLREIRTLIGRDTANFNTLLVWQQTLSDFSRDPPIIKQIDSQDHLEFNLVLEAEPKLEDVTLLATYKLDRLPSKQVELLLSQLDQVLSKIVSDPTCTISFAAGTLEEAALSIGNPNPPIPRETPTLSRLFEVSASTYPTSIALEFVDHTQRRGVSSKRLTYSELNSIANQLAHKLIGLGVATNDVVSVCMEYSTNLYICILAILKAGAVYLPLTPDTPKETALQILRRYGCRVCLALAKPTPLLNFSRDIEIIIPVDNTDLDKMPTSNPAKTCKPSNLPCVISSPNSDGTSKRPFITQENIATNVLSLLKHYPLKQGSRFLHLSSQAYGISVFETFLAWAAGLCHCAANKHILLRNIEEAINVLQIDYLSLLPSVAALINPLNVPSVKSLITFSETVTSKVFNDWADRGLHHAYFLTETAHVLTVKLNISKKDSIYNIGRPLESTSVFILGEGDGLAILPRGSIGELCYRSLYLAHDVSELASTKFITHPEYGKIFRTGVIGRLLADGSIELVEGQNTRENVRELKADLKEIDDALLQSSAVVDVSTLEIEKDGDSQLISFVVLHRQAAAQAHSINVQSSEHLRNIIRDLYSMIRKFLPSHMIPSSIVPVMAMPITSQGRTNKNALIQFLRETDRATLESFQEGCENSDSEWTETERKVAEILAGFTKVRVDELERNTSIFRLGVDSISAIHLSALIEKTGYKRLKVSEIMQHHTIFALGQAIGTTINLGTRDPLVIDGKFEQFTKSVMPGVLEQLQLDESKVVKVLPCTPLQEAMLAERKKGVDSTFYFNHTVFQLRADLDKLKAAWEIALQRNEIMRTCFAVTAHPKHAYAQVVLSDFDFPWFEIKVQEGEDLTEKLDVYMRQVSSILTLSRPPYALALFQSDKTRVLVVTLHHSLYDGFAINLLLEEVSLAYHGLPLPSRITFDKYLQYMELQDFEASDAYWRAALSGFQPFEFPDLTGLSNAYQAKPAEIVSSRNRSSRALSTIESSCRQMSITLLALGQAAWIRLLAAYTGETDICFGNVVSGRTIPVDGVTTITAPCFNTIPFRITLAPEFNNLSLIEIVKEKNIEAMPFQLTPLRRIMNILHTDGQVLFDTLFILQYSKASSLQEPWEVIGEKGEMDYAIVVELVPNRKRDTLDYVLHTRRSAISESYALIILRQIDMTLCALLDSPAGGLSDYSFLDSSLLSISNDSPLTLAETGDRLLHTLFEQHAYVNPSAIALEFLEDSGNIRTWTFGEFNSLANQVAHRLLSKSLQPPETLPIGIEKSPLYYACVLAALKLGLPFTPIDPSLPTQRKLFMLKELGARYILVTDSNGFETISENVTTISVGGGCLDDQPQKNPVVGGQSPDQIAYRLYTSGTTGFPKAVVVDVKNALQTIRASRSILPWNSKSKLLQYAATSFDMCYYDCFMAWNCGFTLCSAGKRNLFDNLEHTIKEMDVTMLDLTPTIASTLNSRNLPNVELLYCAGEAMQQSLAESWEGRCLNSYGPTEASMCCSIVPVDKQVKSVNIGKPFPTAGFSIRSRDSTSLLPILAVGELCISGPQVAREYYKNMDLSESKFIWTNQHQRIYRSGDLVRMLGNGTFEYIGRTDDQVKIRGLRVELDEINNVLKRADSRIKNACTVITKHSQTNKEQLVSFLTVGEGKSYGARLELIDKTDAHNEILDFARKSAQKNLPRYMIPATILIINHIPLSTAGKVDKNKLRQLFFEQDVGCFNCDPPGEEWTEEEVQIRDVLSELSLVPVGKISKSSTIYELGLDSISASQVAEKLRKRGFNVSAIDILEHPSIEEFSSRLMTKRHPNQQVSPIQATSKYLVNFNQRFIEVVCRENDINQETLDAVYPCTALQSGMISQSILLDGNVYCSHILLNLSPSVEISRLKASWNHVTRTHDILRAGFVQTEDRYHSFAMAVYKPQMLQLPWSVIQCGCENLEGLLAEHKHLRSKEIVKDLRRPPWHLTVFDGSNRYLLFSAHHAIFDAHSLQLIYDDVVLHYIGRKHTNRPHFSSLLTIILSNAINTLSDEVGKTFWVDQLQAAPVVKFPNLTVTRVSSTESHTTSLLSSWELTRIEKASRELGFSVNALAQAAWAKLLSVYVGEPVVLYGQVLSGRTGIANADEVVFPCIVTVPTVATISGSNWEVVLQMQRRNTQMLQHQHTPLSSIQRLIGRCDQMFDTIFIYQKRGPNETLLWKIEDESASVDYAISIEVVPSVSDKLLFRFTCRNNLLPAEQSKILLQQFDSVLIDMLEYPLEPCNNLSRLPTSLLSHLPPRQREIPSDVQLAHGFVEKYADATPDNIALEFISRISKDGVERQQWTYRHLEEESNKIANFLLDFGVKTGDLIAICFDKSPHASWTIIGILKAGCGYVALDPSAPIGRKVFIAEDSGAKCVLTMAHFSEELEVKLSMSVFSVASFCGLKEASIKRPNVKDLAPQGLCYCLYTSGTTGTPKGCEITHENVVQAMLAFQRIFKGSWNSESRFLQFASFHFDVSVLEQFWSWSVGICVTSTPRDIIFEDLPFAIKVLGITHLDLTPSLAALLKPQGAPKLAKGVFIVGGEALNQDILDSWGESGVLHNAYGPTEVTIGCTMLPHVPVDGKPSNIGRQFDNVGSFVMFPGTDKLVLRGAIGELCVSGKLVGRGYLNRKTLTDEKFQHLKQYSTRIYRTGDLVRMLYDGSFDFVGRADDQVKLRGQRLEIEEINETLKRADPQVNAVATLVLKHSKQRNGQLVSFVALNDASANYTKQAPPLRLESSPDFKTIKKLLDRCKQYLPPYMVPTYILPISAMPLSVNNKADYKQLRQLYANTSIEAIQKLANSVKDEPRVLSETEASIQTVLAEITGLPRPDIKLTSTVYELGLDSISIISLTRRLKKNGFEMANVSLVMQNISLEELGRALSAPVGQMSEDLKRLRNTSEYLAAYADKTTCQVCSRLGIVEQDIKQILPCSALQEGMIVRFLTSDEPLYLNSFAFEVAKGIDINVLEEAWFTVITTTDILKTCFCETLDGYAQVVLKSTTNKLKTIPLLQGQNVEELLAAERKRLTKSKREFLESPPIHLTFFSSGERHIVALHIFHALYDGNSLPLILMDVHDAYRRKYTTRKYGFPEVMKYILSVDLQMAEKFWRENLSNRRDSPFPRGNSYNPTIDHKLQRFINIDTEELSFAYKSLGCTPQAIFQAAWAVVLASYVGANVTFGMVVSGRTLLLDGVEEVVGPIFNTIPCSFHLENINSWKALVEHLHDFNVRSIPYHHTPLRLIQKWVGVSMDSALFDSLFVYHKVGPEAEKEMLWKLSESQTVLDVSLVQRECGGYANISMEFPISIEVEQTSNAELSLTIAVKGSVMSKIEAQGVSEKFELVLRTILRTPDAALPIFPGKREPRNESLSKNVHTDADTSNHKSFDWSPHAKTIRLAIATLAGVKEDKIDVDCSIFVVGLDSIEAVKLSARLRKENIQLSVSTIMRNPTIRKMSTFLKEASLNSEATSQKENLSDFENESRKYLVGGEIEAIYPATPLQEGMIAESIASGYHFYYNHEVSKINDDVDIQKLQEAWQEAVIQNPILRTSFFSTYELGIETPYMFGQLVHRSCKVDWEEISIPSDQELKSALADAMSYARKRANLFGCPPIKVTIVSASSTRYLILSISHTLYDGLSLSLLHQDVFRAYHGVLDARPSYRPLLQNIMNMDYQQASEFWKQMLVGCGLSEFPSLGGTELGETYRAELVSSLAFPQACEFCKIQGITMQSLGQTCWGLALAYFLNKSDVLFGTVLSGRVIDQSDQMMFPAMTTVPVRATVHGSYRRILQYMQGNIGHALKYQHMPLRIIQKNFGNGVRRKIFDTLFIYQGHRPESKLPREPLYYPIEDLSDIEYNVAIEISPEKDRLIWRVSSKSVVLSLDQTKAVLRSLDALLVDIVSSPDSLALENFERIAKFEKIAIVNSGQKTWYALEPELVPTQKKDTSKEKDFTTNFGGANWTPLQTEIRDVLAAVAKLRKEDIERSQTIFHLGLDSISAIVVSSELRKRGIYLSVAEILTQATIDNMAALCLEKLSSMEERKHMVEHEARLDWDNLLQNLVKSVDIAALLRSKNIDPNTIESVMPGTSGQRYMLSIWKNTKGSFFMPTITLKLSGYVDKDRLSYAWRKLLHSEPILRTTFVSTGSSKLPIVQVIFKHPTLQFVWRERTDMTPSDAIAQGIAEEQMNLTLCHPPARITVLNTVENTVILLTIHHALYDGFSLPLLVQKLQELYNSPDCIPSNTISSTHFKMVVAYTNSLNKSNQQNFWKNYLQGAKSTLLASSTELFIKANSKNRTVLYDSHFIQDGRALENTCRQMGIMLQALFLAAFAKVYTEILNSKQHIVHNELVIGLYNSQRHLPITEIEELRKLPAPTLNLIPLRIRNSGSANLFDLAVSIQGDLIKVTSAEISAGVGMDNIYKWMKQGNEVGDGILIDAYFNHLLVPARDMEEDRKAQRAKTTEEPTEYKELTMEIQTPSAGAGEVTDIYDSLPESVADITMIEELETDEVMTNLDIEMSYKDGIVELGVCGRADLFDMKDAKKLAHGIKKNLAIHTSPMDNSLCSAVN